MSRFIEKIFILSQIFRKYPLCHSRPDRSFRYNGRYFGLCARCLSMYLGGLFAIISAPLWHSVISPETIGMLGIFALLPGGIDGTTQMLGDRESTNSLRGITGLLLGIGTVHLVYVIIYSLSDLLY